VAQPALTRQVRDLERELGVALLERHSKGVTPTLAGEAFARAAMRALADTAAALERAEATAEGVRGRVVIGAMRAVIIHGIAPRLEEALRGEHPEITVMLRELDFKDVVDALVAGSADVVISVKSDDHPAVVTAPLWEEVIDHALLPASHHLAARASVTAGDLAELPLVITRSGTPLALRKRALDALHEHGSSHPFSRWRAGSMPAMWRSRRGAAGHQFRARLLRRLLKARSPSRSRSSSSLCLLLPCGEPTSADPWCAPRWIPHSGWRGSCPGTSCRRSRGISLRAGFRPRDRGNLARSRRNSRSGTSGRSSAWQGRSRSDGQPSSSESLSLPSPGNCRNSSTPPAWPCSTDRHGG
jgi:DNA-binding transcriptional LysR family regulator